jgi:hypothetical protein
VYRSSCFDILISNFASVAIKSGGGNLATLHRRIAKITNNLRKVASKENQKTNQNV